MKTKNNTRDIAILGLFIALMAVLAFVPYIGFIPLTPAISLSIVHLPAIVGTLVLGFKKGMILSLAFGILSFIRAFTPMGVADVTFQNPLIAILPRLFIAPGAYGVYKLMQKLFTSAGKRMAKRSDSSAGFIGGISGTIIGMLITIIIFSSLSAGLAISPVLCALIASPFGCLAGIGLYAAAKNKFKDPERSAVSFGLRRRQPGKYHLHFAGILYLCSDIFPGNPCWRLSNKHRLYKISFRASGHKRYIGNGSNNCRRHPRDPGHNRR